MPRFKSHEWTTFEQHILFCLIVKGIHINGYPDEESTFDGVAFTAAERRRYGLPVNRRRRKSGGIITTREAHMAVTSMLNQALNRTAHVEEDIGLADVSDMISHMLKTKKAAIKLMERSNKGHVTRMLRQVWNRDLRFDGSDKEWEERKKDAEKRRHVEGITKVTDVPNIDKVYERLVGEEAEKSDALWGRDGPSNDLIEESFEYARKIAVYEESLVSVEE